MPPRSPEFGSEHEITRIPERARIFDREIPAWDLIEQTIPADKLKIEFAEGSYQDKLPEELRVFRDEIVRKRSAAGERLRNGPTVALDGWRTETDSVILSTREGRYFDDLATHFALDEKLPDGRTVRSFIDQKGLFRPGGFQHSILAGSLGLGVVLETNDGRVILQERSQRVLLRPGAMQVSIGEGLRLNDVRSGSIHRAITRALREELGTSWSQTQEIVGTKLGMAEDDLQPTIAAYVRSPLSSQQVKQTAAAARGR
ncbi:MAG: hypothetical protein HY420_01925, partial [Candidatus Kerfeldbacteria bacterium]|nr:hypothetical protein [Candidatus Kerfeldbacteria bacterium]